MCLPVCVSDVSEVCLHEFVLLQGSPTHIISQIRTSERHHGNDTSLLSVKWGMGLEMAKNTMKNTTQYNIRSAILPLTRRYRTDLLSERLRRLDTRFYTSAMFSKISTSLRGNTYAQVFTDGNGAVFVSEWTEFEVYDLMVYWDDRDCEDGQSIGRWLGPSHHIGSALCYFILTEKATIISRTSVQHMTKEDFATTEMQDRVKEYYKSLDKHMNSKSEYMSEDNDVDFMTDDVALPVGYQVNEGEYFGLEDTPDIDDMIDTENARTTSI